MDPKKLKEGKTVNYRTRGHASRGKIIEIYRRVNGPWLVLHDKARNTSITLRPKQIVG